MKNSIINFDSFFFFYMKSKKKHSLVLFTIILFSLSILLECNKKDIRYNFVLTTKGGSSPSNLNYVNKDNLKHQWKDTNELTVFGALEQFKLGYLMRKVFVSKYNFLSKSYAQNEISLYSIDERINLSSMKILSSGLYPINTGSKINSTDIASTIPNTLEIPEINKDLESLIFYSTPSGKSIIPINIINSLDKFYKICASVAMK